MSAEESSLDGSADPSSPRYCFRLYVAGHSPRSRAAIQMLSRLNDGHLGGLAEVEIIDIYQHTGRAWQDRIIGVPALIQERPAPPCQLSGDLSDETWILQALGLGAPEAVTVSTAVTVPTDDEP